MKRFLTTVVAVTLLLSFGMTTASAYGYGRRTGCGPNFVDADGDGVCDNAGTGCGPNFVDADGDGICDNAGLRPRNGTGYGRRCGRGCHR